MSRAQHRTSRAVLGTQKLPQRPMMTLRPFSDTWKGASSCQCHSWGQATLMVTSLRATMAWVHTSARSPKQHEPVDPPLQGRTSHGVLDPGSRGTAWKHRPHPGQALPGIRRTLKAEDEGRALDQPAPATTAPSGSCHLRHHRDALTQVWRSRLPLSNLPPHLYRSASAFSGGRRSGTQVGRAFLPHLSTHSPAAASPWGSPSLPGPFSSRLHPTAKPLSRLHPLVPDAAPAPSERVRWQSAIRPPV